MSEREQEARALGDLASNVAASACGKAGLALIMRAELGPEESHFVTGFARNKNASEPLNSLVLAKAIVFLEREVTMHAARSANPSAFMKTFSNQLIRARAGTGDTSLITDVEREPPRDLPRNPPRNPGEGSNAMDPDDL